jgi:hypothetical protein
VWVVTFTPLFYLLHHINLQDFYFVFQDSQRVNVLHVQVFFHIFIPELLRENLNTAGLANNLVFIIQDIYEFAAKSKVRRDKQYGSLPSSHIHKAFF